MKEKKIDKKVLVVGGQPDGLEISRQLTDRGFDVLLVEKDNKLGMRFLEDKLMPLSFESPAEYVNNLVNDVENNSRIEIMKDTVLEDVEGYIGNYIVHLKKDKIFTAAVSALVLTGGMGTEGDYKDITDNFISLSRFKKLFNPLGKLRGRILSVGAKAPKTVVFLLTGNSLSRYIFSQVLNYAMFLRKKTGTTVWILLPHVLTAGGKLEKYYRNARNEGVIIKQYDKIPGVNYKAEDRVIINIHESQYGDLEIRADLLVYGEKIIRSGYLDKLRKVLKFKDYANINFLSSKMPRKGIYFCSPGRDDILFEELITETKETVKDIFDLMGDGKIKYEDNVIEVDKVRCALCLTCVRACPHTAIEMRQNTLGERAVSIIEEACFHCGVCVSECPAKALSYKENIS